jgi:transposase
MLKHIDELDDHIATVSGLIDKLMTEEQLLAADKITQVTGIGHTSAQAIISVIGSDMSRFPTDASISKWAGLCPGNNESAKKRGSGRTQKGNKLLKTTLTVCANSAVKNKDSYFYAQFKRISAHRGKKRAIIAVAHSMLIAIYHMLKDNVDFVDLGSDYYNRFNKEKKINAYIKKLQALGAVVELKPTTTQIA